MNLTREEQETIIGSNAASQEWDVCTADPRVIRYLEKRGYKKEPDHQFSEPYVKFTVPFNRLRFLSREKRKSTGKGFPARQTACQNESISEKGIPV